MRTIEEVNGSYILYEEGVSRLVLSRHSTREEAEIENKKWDARDSLYDKVYDFYCTMIDDYKDELDISEILQIIETGID